MMTFVTANIASGSRETINRTPTFATTIRGDASQTMRKIGRVLRSALRRSFQRGTGLAICGCNCFFRKISFHLCFLSVAVIYTLSWQQRPKNALLRLTSHAKDEKLAG